MFSKHVKFSNYVIYLYKSETLNISSIFRSTTIYYLKKLTLRY